MKKMRSGYLHYGFMAKQQVVYLLGWSVAHFCLKNVQFEHPRLRVTEVRAMAMYDRKGGR